MKLKTKHTALSESTVDSKLEYYRLKALGGKPLNSIQSENPSRRDGDSRGYTAISNLAAIKHHRARPTRTGIRRSAVNAEEVVGIVAGLVAYGVVLALLLFNSSAPTPAKNAESHASDSPAASAQHATTAGTVTAVQTTPVQAVTPPPLAPIAKASDAHMLLLDRRSEARDLLDSAEKSKSDLTVYRQTLGAIVKKYSDTPEGAEALKLLTATDPATSVTPAVTAPKAPATPPAPAVSEAPSSLKTTTTLTGTNVSTKNAVDEEVPSPHVLYGPSFLNQ